jgi:DNA-binding MarR family transcriptional regulator
LSRDLLIEAMFANSLTVQKAWKSFILQSLGKNNISLAQAGLLFILKNRQPIKGSELADEMHISRSAVTQLIEGLETSNFITRTESTQDRRIQYISLSSYGTDRLKEIDSKRKALFILATSTLDNRELKALIAMQSKMIEHFRHNKIIK